MRQPDEDILRTYFRLEEAQRQRLWMERIWHPELFDWAQGHPPPTSNTKRLRQEELERLGFGEVHYERMKEVEDAARREMEELVELHCLWPHFELLRGFGKYLCGAFIAAGGDIDRAPTCSSFWKGMGLDVLPQGLYTSTGKEILPPGSVPRRIRGAKNLERKIPCLPHVSRIGEQIRQQMLRSGGKLYQKYLAFRAKVDLAHPGRAKIFNMKDALRRTQKVLYACLWREWRTSYGLRAPMPYAFDILKHDDGSLITIADFYDGEPDQQGDRIEGRARG